MMKIAPKGNEHIRNILTDYVDKIIETGHIPVPFLLFTGPSWLWKITVAEQMAKNLLQQFFVSDCLMLCDYTQELEKPHTIKISSEDVIQLSDWSFYNDLGIREVHEWMVKSPTWKFKCLIIEDIERLTEQAANALLKILEEPLPWRLIIATCSEQSYVLPTILSRALLFSFYPVDDKHMDAYILEQPFLQGFDRGFLYALANGRVGILESLVKKPDSIKALQRWYESLVHSYPIWLQLLYGQQDTTADKIHVPVKTPFEVYKDILPVLTAGYHKILLQAYIYYAAKQQSREHVALAQETINLCNYAIKNEHIFYDFLLRLDVITRT